MKNKTKKILAWAVASVTTMWLWVEYYAWIDKWYEVSEYRWVPVTHDRYECWNIEAIVWCYFYDWPRKGSINMERWIAKWQYDKVLKHEYWHHLYFARMTEKERKAWDRITDKWFIVPILKRYGYELQPEYVSFYARTNKIEDFADSYSSLKVKTRTYAWLKQSITDYFDNKYPSD